MFWGGLTGVLILGLMAAVALDSKRKNEYADYYVHEKGEYGEDKIYDILERIDGYKAILPNCYLPKGNGETAEVDLILLHESGIYVFESKNYSGWIFGSENQKYWTQSFSDRREGTKKYKFYNPLWQNDTHIRALQGILQDENVNIYSYIVFGNDCDLMDVQVSQSNYYIVQRRELLQSVLENAEYYGKILSNDEIDEIYRILLPYAMTSPEEKEAHDRNVREKYKV